MIECGEENYPNNPNSCWRVPGLPDDLEADDIEKYNIPQGFQGPRDPKDPHDIERNNIRYKWRTRGVREQQLLQLKFHDCLR